MIPDTWTWALVTASIADFLGNGLAQGAVIMTLGVILAPMGVIALKRMVRRG